jgi:hypothetical protein
MQASNIPQKATIFRLMVSILCPFKGNNKPLGCFPGEMQLTGVRSTTTSCAAQTIITGRITQIGEFYRFGMRAISVESAEIQGQFNHNISNGPIISALTITQSSSAKSSSNQNGMSSQSSPLSEEKELLPELTGENTNGKYAGTTWSDGLTPPDTIIFGNHTLKLNGTYWGRSSGKILESNIYNNLIQVWTAQNEGFELMEYRDGRLIVQGQKPHFFSKEE